MNYVTLILALLFQCVFAIKQDTTITIVTFSSIGGYLIIVAIVCVVLALLRRKRSGGEYAPLNGN
ncbi:hypothetical protein ENUP19_0134G0020 [Entamoeba nuttalli]|uniref:Uncharacterized protein n=1 Tax=Entamoeba nuttalli TaxID=412467 RepID=A0ABQ0DK13_9EUKA